VWYEERTAGGWHNWPARSLWALACLHRRPAGPGAAACMGIYRRMWSLVTIRYLCRRIMLARCFEIGPLPCPHSGGRSLGFEAVGINRRFLLGSTVGFCWDRSSALAGIDRRLLLGSTASCKVSSANENCTRRFGAAERRTFSVFLIAI
jgi:hypothetical protein